VDQKRKHYRESSTPSFLSGVFTNKRCDIAGKQYDVVDKTIALCGAYGENLIDILENIMRIPASRVGDLYRLY
jgi:hypothetical protein